MLRLIAFSIALCVPAAAEVNRVVIIKVDGLPERLIERYTAESAGGARTGRSRLPWIQHVFGKNGAWVENFYVRGVSISAPSWSLLDTGRHLEIRGNAEYDRYTLRVFDYLNFFPFYVGYATKRQADMPGVEMLDENHVPLLIDRFPGDERYQSLQLLQRGVNWQTLESALKNRFSSRQAKELFDEWQIGFSMTNSVGEQSEREMIAKLKDPNVHYLDFFTGDFDHTAHLTPDRVSQLHVIESLDALVGRVWAAIAASPLAKTTMLVMVSDHGMNTSEGVYSQGYNLIDWFNSATGGGHHVLTNRHPMEEFKIRGLDPFVSEVISPSSASTYLAGEGVHYPTAVLDLDGNERASVSLRNNSLNIVHILLDQLIHKHPTGRVRAAELKGMFLTLDRVRPQWQKNIDQLSEELHGVRARIAERQKMLNETKKIPREERQRLVDHLEIWREEDRTYSAYIATMTRLLSLNEADFDPGKFNTDDLIPRRSLGDRNSPEDLQNYVVGLGPSGIVVARDSSLDFDATFRHIDYFKALSLIQVRNNIQKEVAPRPVDFIAVPMKDAVWLWRSPERQALILTRRGASGELELKYLPVTKISADEDRTPHYDRASWTAGLPLEICEDPKLAIPQLREPWLNEWHTEHEWLRAVHQTKYSNGIIGIVEEMLSDPSPSPYLERERQLRRADMIVFANDHWNFNVRGFNPGGNHGSFLRVSTNSVLMFAGGEDTGIPRGARITAPYDSLSFVPTILTLMGRAEPDLPGPVIKELLSSSASDRDP